MGAFELQDIQDTVSPEPASMGCSGQERKKTIIDECIVAYKVYDSCRRQNCLTPSDLGPARSICGSMHHSGDSDSDSVHGSDIVVPPQGAASVSMNQLKIAKIMVMDKRPSPFRRGFWDVSLKFIFEYGLIFREVNGSVIEPTISAANSFTMRTTLFGSLGSDLVVGTDLFKSPSGSSTFTAAPFVWVEAKAMGLDAKIVSRHGHHDHCREEVHVTIGLFSVLKLFRMVNLNVQSTGFCIPSECKGSHDVTPCDYFADLDFPMDIFAPPQKADFFR